ncbi:ROK family protein [Nonomuraea sp. NBC_01738]|uniref:ROK family protein n=1 Tax=Nonomuraea sp. NBC_01738 TaxID=2976003 RepID=UPI002E0FD9DA|nr:ROK family protein [Nonomuraea sp. NBC_01738]
MRTGSPTVLRTLNERAALELLLRYGSLTRAELETHTGLSKASAAEVLRRLEKGGLARKGGHKPGPAGPAAQLWVLDGGAAHVAGVDLTADAVEVAVADLAGTVCATHRATASGSMTDGDGLGFIAGALAHAAAEAGTEVAELDSIVVGVPGVVEPGGERLSQAVQLSGWPHLGDLTGLGARLGQDRVRLENDVNLVTIRELSLREQDSFVLFWLGGGVGAGAVLNGALWRGASGRGGEIGSVVVPDPVTRGRLHGQEGGLLGDLLGVLPLAALADAHGHTLAAPGDVVALLAGGDAHPAFLADVAARVSSGSSRPSACLTPGSWCSAGRCAPRRASRCARSCPNGWHARAWPPCRSWAAPARRAPWTTLCSKAPSTTPCT